MYRLWQSECRLTGIAARWQIVGAIAAILAVSPAVEEARAAPAPSAPTAAREVADGNVREAIAALRARFRFDTKEGLAALRELSLGVLREGLKDEDPYERCYAANALAEQGDWSGRDVLENAIASLDSGLRRAAIDGLGAVGHGEALRILRRIYRDSDGFGRLLVLQGLRGSGSREAFDLLMEAVRDPDPSLRLQAVEDLGLFGAGPAIPAVRDVLAREDARMFERITAAHALLRLGDHTGVPLLLTALEGGPGSGRAAATLALGYAKEGRLVPVLEKLLEDTDLDVKIAAATALTRHGRKDGMPRLRRALEDEDAATRRHVATLLEHVDYTIAREVVLAGLSASDVGVGLAAAQVVGLAGGSREIGALTAMLRANRDPMVRADVALALGRMSSRRVIDPLVELVQEEAPAVRYTAAEGLVRIVSRLIGTETIPSAGGTNDVGAVPRIASCM
jgi:HEAT repeat protein